MVATVASGRRRLAINSCYAWQFAHNERLPEANPDLCFTYPMVTTMHDGATVKVVDGSAQYTVKVADGPHAAYDYVVRRVDGPHAAYDYTVRIADGPHAAYDCVVRFQR